MHVDNQTMLSVSVVLWYSHGLGTMKCMGLVLTGTHFFLDNFLIQLCFGSSKQDGGIYLNAYIFFIEWKTVNLFWSHRGFKPGSGLSTFCEKGNFSQYFGGENLGNCSLYMALHPIPSPHLGKISPKFFNSVRKNLLQSL